MIEETDQQIDEKNRWRVETPGHQGWQRTARPDDAGRYLMISADCHCNEPSKIWAERIDRKFRDRLPHIEVDDKGEKWMVVEGYQRSRVRTRNIADAPRGGEDRLRGEAGRDPLDRIRDHALDGIDAEVIFPNKGLAMWATQDAEFGAAQCRVWNDWAWETFGPYNSFMSPMAAIMTADLGLAIAEIKRVAALGFRGVTLPCKPIWGAHDARHPNYNLPLFDPLWSVIVETGLPVTFHVSTGRDPRAARADGGAIINYVSHSLSPTIEPIANLCASGVIERFPALRFAAIECGIGWVPWALDAMDEAYRKHHLWAYPKLKQLPSEYFRSNGGATFQEDAAGLKLAAAWRLTDNFMWANDYPHAEGTWPHSAQAIEREMGTLSDADRAKILGLNAARFFKFDAQLLLKRRKSRAATVN
ncbi:MAG TPA: amidohydrolase family protein [Candidatus Binataceae bacterium]|nr:amidohydrolase family protein [Candidatus Binataceae bacterium]